MTTRPRLSRGLRRLSPTAPIVWAGLVFAPLCVSAQTTGDTMTAPQDPASTSTGTKAGEQLGERLDRSKGLITPPDAVDPKMEEAAPSPGPNATPVIVPPAASRDGLTVQPK